MIFKRQRKTAPTYSVDFDESGGRDDCPHEWWESLPWTRASTYGSGAARCVDCGRLRRHWTTLTYEPAP